MKELIYKSLDILLLIFSLCYMIAFFYTDNNTYWITSILMLLVAEMETLKL